MRVAVIGAGHVGATAAYALLLRGLASEIVLIDTNPEAVAVCRGRMRQFEPPTERVESR